MYLFVSALDEAGGIPALRALQRISEQAEHLKLASYAGTRLYLSYSPARAALIAREVEKARLSSEADVLLG